MSLFLFSNFYSDSAKNWQMNFQDPATPIMEGLINLHHFICFFLIVILFFVLYFLDNVFTRDIIYPFFLLRDSYYFLVIDRVKTYLAAFKEVEKKPLEKEVVISEGKISFTGTVPELIRTGSKKTYITDESVLKGKKKLTINHIEKSGGSFSFFAGFFFESLLVTKILYRYIKTAKKTHDCLLELIWTIIPSFILVLIAIPSFSLLYAMDEVISPSLTLKVIGHQWYWAYEYSDYIFDDNNAFSSGAIDYPGVIFDSYMIPEDELNVGDLRLLEVDNSVVLPINTHIRIIVTAGDVLHAWAVPSLGVKVDAVPGRLNQTSIFIKRPGVFYGQCSEICGVNHGFMPIVVEALPLLDYYTWILNKLENA